ncbi:flagellar biosynthesis protein FlhF [Priestia megaterium]|nr:flagellar biosynthesis protein FlhF [Priestia megaterium]
MKVKKYIAASMPEAMKLIRAELGEKAVILKSKPVQTGGFMGLFSKQKMEVIAAVDTVNDRKPKQKLPNRKEKEQVSRQVDEQQITKQLNELKQLVASMNQPSQSHAHPKIVNDILTFLREQDIEETILKQLTTDLLAYYYVNQSIAEEEFIPWGKEWFLTKFSSIKNSGISKKYVNVVGPTGVGKTTTLAKLAGKCVIEKKQKVAFITTDTYRISAIDQLKTYASILNAPIEVCYNNEDFKKAVDAFEQYDVVFIDTAGRNFLKSKYVQDLQNVISFQANMQTFLVLSMTSKLSDMEKIYQQFSLLPIDSFIFTKLDETMTFGSMINMFDKYNKQVSFVTTGQNVPDDIQDFTIETAVDYLFGEWRHE